MEKNRKALEQFNSDIRKALILYGVMEAIFIYEYLREAAIYGISGTFFLEILAWTYVWAIATLYRLGIDINCPGTGLIGSLLMVYRVKGEDRRELNKLWRRSFLIAPVINEIKDYKRSLEYTIAADATDVTANKFAEL